MRNKIIVTGVCAIAFSTAFVSPVSALSIGELQDQIQALLSKIAELTNEIDSQRNGEISRDDLASRHRICAVLSRNLSQGASGEDVRELQVYLREEGYLSVSATGYFGSATSHAVSAWQKAQGIPVAGAIGPRSREHFKIWCDGISGSRFAAEPRRGSAPLTVTFKTNVQLANGGMVADAGDYKIVFGDGTEHVFLCSGASPWCAGPHRVEHTYHANGTYNAQLVHFGYFGMPGLGNTAPQQIVGTATIFVGETACTKEYRPVCGLKSIVCITTPCNPIQQTYGNECAMKADGAAFLHEGACRSNDPANDPACRVWFDGCNTCSRETPSALSLCTLRACTPDTMSKPYCTHYFDHAGNQPPVISSFSGPTTLSINETGTWSVVASDPENGSLTYHVSWGDERGALPLANDPTQETYSQATTFTHAYTYAGVFTVRVVVRDSVGKEAKTTTMVRVSEESVACTLQYDPVCATPHFCLISKFSAGAYPRECEYGKTYGNKCQMNAEKAVFKYTGECRTSPVACTREAKQCPDGSYVERTGPHCAFTECPTQVVSTCLLDGIMYEEGAQITSSGLYPGYAPCCGPRGCSLNTFCPIRTFACKAGTWQ